jgi:hypothetical protein
VIRALAIGGATLALLAGAMPARAQSVAARFDISAVGDSTFTFAVGANSWVPRKTRGIVVDPARRDALVARFRLLAVRDGVVTALVTGQTTRVTPSHVVVMEPPPPPRWFRHQNFWGGAAAGALAGTVIGWAIGAR